MLSPPCTRPHVGSCSTARHTHSARSRPASMYLQTGDASARPIRALGGAVRSLFATKLYEADLGEAELLGELAFSIRSLAEDDGAGLAWSREHRYAGYTSYASLNDLPKRDPAFADLAKLLTRHAAKFAVAAGFAQARKPRLDSLWVNLLKSGGSHSGHIHPHAIISGTFYVEVPP